MGCSSSTAEILSPSAGPVGFRPCSGHQVGSVPRDPRCSWRLIERWRRRWTARPPSRCIPSRRDAGRGPWRSTGRPSARSGSWPSPALAIMGFVFSHAVGNLKVYLGPEDFNHYGEFLRELLVPILPRTVALWLLRIGLIVAFALHIHSAYGLTRMNHRANGPGYQQSRDYLAANAASRSMRWTGIIVGLFILFHLADLTWGTREPRLRAGRRLPELRRHLRAADRGGHLHRRQPRPGPAPVPRRLVDVPEPRRQQPALELVAPRASPSGLRR